MLLSYDRDARYSSGLSGFEVRSRYCSLRSYGKTFIATRFNEDKKGFLDQVWVYLAKYLVF